MFTGSDQKKPMLLICMCIYLRVNHTHAKSVADPTIHGVV